MRTAIRSIDSLGNPGNRLIDMRSRSTFRGSVNPTRAWEQIAAATVAKVVGGPVSWGSKLVDSLWQEHVQDLEGTNYSATAPTGDNGNYWLYAQANLTTSAVTVAFMTTANEYPLDDYGNSLVRFPLSLWRVARTEDALTTFGRVFILHEHGRLYIPSHFAPPRT